MSYRKQISYLELQENGQRIRSAGYARLESLDKEEILTVQLNGQEIVSGKGILLYLQWESGEQQLCEMTIDQGRASCEKRIPLEKEWEQILGIRIPLERNLEIIGRFVRGGDAKKKPAQEADKQPREQPPEAAETVVTSLVPSQGDRISKRSAAENTLHMKDTKWEQLSSIYPHIHPFRDAREFLSVGPEDFVVLRERCYQMTHNSFLLHGYYNYRHLLLLRQETAGQAKYYIGVPGNFYEREKQVARMFGFESFEGAREPAWEGDFGYYLISVEL
ncbi:MAG: DUF6128 domain-containing protein [Lachnospiraceae bacterium]|uniref:DUF6128 domain-containing protein n=1 Tax=Waltera intestinalis TaxID=2606635 RepID=A0A6L5YJ07_9FIRM|nr:DUF6128 domain-containing protein [Waltera intestinalis]MDY3657182.1 DUF6128 domain-containing protein [Lachnospiraceae bacterium]MST58129.1 hypothetical protein [Waltera intestinalis]